MAARVIERAALLGLMERGAVRLIDVREPHEVAATGPLKHGRVSAANVPLGRVQGGALELPEQEFRAQFGVDKPAKGDLVVFSCRSGARSERASQHAMVANGFTNVFNYKGSANEWFAAAGPAAAPLAAK
jgi:rhodanese-related sulfurtransferase